MSQWQYAYDNARQMAREHAVNHQDIEALADSAPDDCDGGEGAELILSALSAITKDAGVLSRLNNVADTQLRATVDLVKGLNQETDDMFRSLEKEISNR